jgi:hypothetical protein
MSSEETLVSKVLVLDSDRASIEAIKRIGNPSA